MTTPDFASFEKKIGITFKNKALLRQAFTHRSYINENKDSGLDHNERLEFLGDAVLELAITDHLYKKYTDKTEGDLTAYRSALVNATTCAEVATTLGVNNFLLLSRGEMKDTGRARQYILANTLESIIGAIFLDQGYDSAKNFILENISPLIEGIIEKGTWIDSKSLFQEKAQDIEGATPLYKTTKETGPDHDKHFTVGVYLGKTLIASGDGQSKQDAEQKAAENALKIKDWK
jgi:ribonuclease-3